MALDSVSTRSTTATAQKQSLDAERTEAFDKEVATAKASTAKTAPATPAKPTTTAAAPAPKPGATPAKPEAAKAATTPAGTSAPATALSAAPKAGATKAAEPKTGAAAAAEGKPATNLATDPARKPSVADKARVAEAGKEAKSAYEKAAADPGQRELLTKALTGKGGSDLSAEQKGKVDDFLDDVSKGDGPKVTFKAAANSGETDLKKAVEQGGKNLLPGNVEGAFIEGKKGGTALISNRLDDATRQTVAREEYGEALAAAAEKRGIVTSKGDDGERLGLALDGKDTSKAAMPELHSDQPTDKATVVLGGKAVEAKTAQIKGVHTKTGGGAAKMPPGGHAAHQPNWTTAKPDSLVKQLTPAQQFAKLPPQIRRIAEANYVGIKIAEQATDPKITGGYGVKSNRPMSISMQFVDNNNKHYGVSFTANVKGFDPRKVANAIQTGIKNGGLATALVKPTVIVHAYTQIPVKLTMAKHYPVSSGCGTLTNSVTLSAAGSAAANQNSCQVNTCAAAVGRDVMCGAAVSGASAGAIVMCGAAASAVSAGFGVVCGAAAAGVNLATASGCGVRALGTGVCAARACGGAATIAVACVAAACGSHVVVGAGACAGNSCGAALTVGVGVGSSSACGVRAKIASATVADACGINATAAAACAGQACGANSAALGACAGNVCAVNANVGPDWGPCIVNFIPFIPLI